MKNKLLIFIVCLFAVVLVSIYFFDARVEVFDKIYPNSDQKSELKKELPKVNTIVQPTFLSLMAVAQKIFSNSTSCSCHLEGKTFEENVSSSFIELDTIKAGCAKDTEVLFKVESQSSDVSKNVKKIVIKNILKTSKSNEFESELFIEPFMDKTKELVQLQPIKIRFTTQLNTTQKNKKILGCVNMPLKLPQDFRVVADDGRCELSWQEQKHTQPVKYMVSSYMVDAKNTGQSSAPNYQFASGSSLNLTGLMNDKKYVFSIQALTSDQNTEWSEKIECTPQKKSDSKSNP